MTQILGPLMIDVEGTSLSSEDYALLKSPAVGGLILFSRNFESHEQLRLLISEIRSVAPNIIIAVDHEGGRVQRFRDGFSQIPPMRELGDAYLKDEHLAKEKARDYGELIALELGAFDIDISFAPVLDLDYGVSDVIGDRAFSDDMDATIVLSQAFIEGMRAGGMPSTGKHYPGHGAVEADSHVDIPVDGRTLAEIKARDLEVFKQLAEKGLDAVMPAHVIYDQVDTLPAGFSELWLEQILRSDCGFDGVIFSDDLSMEGASVAGSFTQRAEAAINAGCDMVLVCNNRAAAREIDEFLRAIIDDGSYTPSSRLKRMQGDKSKQFGLVELRETSLWKKYN